MISFKPRTFVPSTSPVSRERFGSSMTIFSAMRLLIAVLALCMADRASLKADEAEQSLSRVPHAQRFTSLGNLPSRVGSLTFSADGQTLLIGLENEVQVLALAEREITRKTPIKRGLARGLIALPDGTGVLFGAYRSCQLLGIPAWEIAKEYAGHTGGVTALALSPAGTQFVSGCDDESIRVYDVKSGTVKSRIGDPQFAVNGVAWSPDGKFIAAAIGDETRVTKPGATLLYDATSGELIQSWKLHKKAVTSVAFSPNGKLLLSTGVAEEVHVYEIDGGKALGYFAGHTRPTNGVVVLPDSQFAISCSGGGFAGQADVRIWNIATGDEVQKLEDHAARVSTLAVSSDGAMLATGGHDRAVHIYRLAYRPHEVDEAAAANSPEPR